MERSPYGLKFLLAALILAAQTASARTASAQTAGNTMPVNMGINVDWVSDYAVESFFVDAMKQARHWGSVATPWDEAAAVDTRGWPTQDAGVIVLCCIGNAANQSVLSGTYALSFRGIAQVQLQLWPGSVGPISYDPATNTSTGTVTLDPGDATTSLYLGFTQTQRTATSAIGTGVTDVVLRRPRTAPNGTSWWTDPHEIFTTPYLKLLAPYSTLRFMDFTDTNGTAVTSWGQRRLPTDATQQGANGAAWEYAIALANLTHKDMWVNIPDQADDGYVRQLATLMHDTLDPGLNVYTEYSNEVWNYAFGQAGRNQAAAEATVAADPSSPLAIGCSDYADCRYVWGERRIGQRALQIGRTFRTVFGPDAARVRPVYATQLDQTYFVGLVMQMVSAAYGKPADFFYAIAQAPYFTGDNYATNGLTTQQALNQARLDLPQVAKATHDFAALATYWGVRSVTYEGGPGMYGSASVDAKVAANRSPAMFGLVAQYLRSAFANDVSLFMYFNDAGQYGQYGSWGTTENVFDLNTPKIGAIHAVERDGTEALATGHMLPATFASGSPDIQNGGYIVTGGSYAYDGAGNSFSYLLDAPVAGSYAFTLSTANYYGTTSATLRIDQARVGQVKVPAGTGPGNWNPSSTATLPLTAGLHMLTIGGTGQGFAFQSVTVAAP